MLNITKLRGPLIMAIFPLQKYNVHKSVNEQVETPMERIKKLFVSTPYEPVTKELRTLMTLTTASGIIGALVGGVIHMQGSVEKFIDNNQATRFYSQFDAKRELQTSVSIQFIKGSFKLGWRAAVFSSIYGFVQLLLTTYYGKPAVWHYMAGGGVAGFIFKMSLGMRGSLVGLVVGSICGGIGGSIILWLLKVTNITMEDLQNIQQEWANLNRQKRKKAMMEKLPNEYFEAKALYDETKQMQTESIGEEEKT